MNNNNNDDIIITSMNNKNNNNNDKDNNGNNINANNSSRDSIQCSHTNTKPTSTPTNNKSDEKEIDKANKDNKESEAGAGGERDRDSVLMPNNKIISNPNDDTDYSLSHLFENNSKWAKQMEIDFPGFFQSLAQQQKPKVGLYYYITISLYHYITITHF